MSGDGFIELGKKKIAVCSARIQHEGHFHAGLATDIAQQTAAQRALARTNHADHHIQPTLEPDGNLQTVQTILMLGDGTVDSRIRRIGKRFPVKVEQFKIAHGMIISGTA